MNHHLTPTSPVVPADTVLTLAIRDTRGDPLYKQFLVMESFDYLILLEEIQESGILKSESVMQRLTELLIQREFVRPIDACLLDIGEQGRVSTAVKYGKKHRLNPSIHDLDSLVHLIERGYYDVQGPEGDLHLLHVDHGPTLGHVTISLENDTGISRIARLDIVGPSCADFPDRFTDLVSDRLMDEYQSYLTGCNVHFKVDIARSDLALAEQALSA